MTCHAYAWQVVAQRMTSLFLDCGYFFGTHEVA